MAISNGRSGTATITVTAAFADIQAGYDTACILTSAGAAYCWGKNDSGQLGDGTTTQRLTPVAVAQGTLVFSALTAGGHYTCGRTGADAAYCWGESNHLGDGTPLNPALNRLAPGAAVVRP